MSTLALLTQQNNTLPISMTAESESHSLLQPIPDSDCLSYLIRFKPPTVEPFSKDAPLQTGLQLPDRSRVREQQSPELKFLTKGSFFFPEIGQHVYWKVFPLHCGDSVPAGAHFHHL